MRGRIKFVIEGDECSFIESCLNIVSSGYDPDIGLFLFALAKGWHISKLQYYYKMINDEKDKFRSGEINQKW